MKGNIAGLISQKTALSIILGIIALAAVTVASMTGCDTGDTGNTGWKGDKALNGIWVPDNIEDIDIEITLNNGKYEASGSLISLQSPVTGSFKTKIVRGNYTASRGIITQTMTDIHGAFLSIMKSAIMLMYGIVIDAEFNTGKWYSLSELKKPFGDIIYNNFIKRLGVELSGEYIVIGNKLIITANGETQTFTRK
jgi:hypothetical protein